MRSLLVLLMILVLAGATFGVYLPVNANPHFIEIPSAPAPAGVHITFDMESPTENATYANGTINVVFNVTVDGPSQINGQPLTRTLC
jgi:hypothetical protein